LEPFAREDVLDAGGTVEFLPLALATARSIGLPFGFFRWIWLPFVARCSSFFAER
jgi:hypothetical protein